MRPPCDLSKGVYLMWVAALASILGGCTRRLSLSVELFTPESPDPFSDVRTVRLRAYAGGALTDVGEDRWDQGPIELPVDVDPTLESIVVEGRSESGKTVSSGAAGPFDFLRDPPDGPVQIYFSREGVLSLARERGDSAIGRRAVQLGDGRVLFLAGESTDGCEVTSTEIFATGPPRLSRGPDLPTGRAGEVEIVALSSDRVVAVGGRNVSGCQDGGRTDEVLVLDLLSSEVKRGTGGGRAQAPGVAVSAISESSVLLAGGGFAARTSSTVHELRLDDFQLVRRGLLDEPRAGASAVPVDRERVAFLGGRSRFDDPASLVDRVSVFQTRGGLVEGGALRLPEAVDRPGVLRTDAKSILVVGGMTTDQFPSRTISMAVVRQDFEANLGDVTRVAELPADFGVEHVIDLGDGRVLLLPSSPDDDPLVLDPIRRGFERVPRPDSTSTKLVGGRLLDGQVVLVDEFGRYLTFNPGVGAVVGHALSDGDLSLAAPPGLRIFPRRPAAWRQTQDGMEGSFDNVSGSLAPEEYVLIGRESIGDFELSFTMSTMGLSKAGVLVAVDDERYEYVVLHGTTQVERSLSRTPQPPLDCNAVPTRDLASPGEHAISISRTGSVLGVDVGADGSRELTCDTGRSSRGRVGLAVIAGTVTFNRLQLRTP